MRKHLLFVDMFENKGGRPLSGGVGEKVVVFYAVKPRDYAQSRSSLFCGSRFIRIS